MTNLFILRYYTPNSGRMRARLATDTGYLSLITSSGHHYVILGSGPPIPISLIDYNNNRDMKGAQCLIISKQKNQMEWGKGPT